MDETLRNALRKAFDEAKVIDSDVLRHPTLAAVIAKVTAPEHIPAAVAEARKLRPKWFQGWDRMNDREFAQQENALRDGLRSIEQNSEQLDALVAAVRKIDASKLSQPDFETLDRTLSAISRKDWSGINQTEIARLQKATA